EDGGGEHAERCERAIYLLSVVTDQLAGGEDAQVVRRTDVTGDRRSDPRPLQAGREAQKDAVYLVVSPVPGKDLTAHLDRAGGRFERRRRAADHELEGTGGGRDHDPITDAPPEVGKEARRHDGRLAPRDALPYVGDLLPRERPAAEAGVREVARIDRLDGRTA